MIQNLFFPEIHGNFGFGCMRLPMKDGKVNYDEFCRMADAFITSGLNYFDTAHGYIGGQSETAIRDCVAKRHNRSEFLLTDKLTEPYFRREEDIRPFFESQLKACGVEYFDFYLMHAQDRNNYQKYKRCRAYETALQLKAEGKLRHFGISFHDKAEVLDMILTEHPEIEIVQIQFNYVDYEDASVESRKVYEACEKHGKPVIVMEPVKGGSLVNLPAEADRILRGLNERRQQRQLRPALRRFLPEHGHGALRHEQYGADGGQPVRHGGLPSPERSGNGSRAQGVRYFPQPEPDPLHRLPLLCGGKPLPQGHSHPGRFFRDERP